jgi:hypothetical protein
MPQTLAELLDRNAVVDAVNRLFIFTDNKDWDALRALFTDRVALDMSSLSGIPAAEVGADEVVGGWRAGLGDIEAVHHQSGNHLVTLRGERAEVFCYGVATHYRPAAEKRVTTFVGSYDFGLERGATGWRIHSLRFNKKYVE